jgi:hypothetical protein
VNELAFVVVTFEVWNLESPHGVERQSDRLVCVAAALRFSQALPDLAQGTKNPGPIKPLALAVFTIVRHEICTSASILN